jgi:hypothetical protein
MLGLTDTPFLPAWVPAQSMFTAEARRKRTLLERIHDGIGRSEELFEDYPHSYTREKGLSKRLRKQNTGEVEQTSDDFSEEENVNRLVNSTLTTLVWILWV